MCRLLGYLGTAVSLEKLLYTPEHSLIVQSYQPHEMLSGLLNADGFGMGWYHLHQDTEPFTYKSTLPIWNDENLPSLSRYIESKCTLAYVRSATPGQALDFANCQPFKYQHLLFTHNGLIENFRRTLYRPIRNLFSDEVYQLVKGTTDSEHMFGLLVNQWQANPGKSLEQALHTTLLTLTDLAQQYQASVRANIMISDGKRLVASRFACNSDVPSLYWLQDDATFPQAVIIASEPLFAGDWHPCPENTIISVADDFEIQVQQI